jgi:hypothetical protein
VRPYLETALAHLDGSWHPSIKMVLEDCICPPNGERAAFPEEVDLAAFLMARGVSDCEALDSYRADSFFTDRFKKALQGKFAYAGVMWAMVVPTDKKREKPITDAAFLGKNEALKALTICWLKDMVRDGIPPALALANIRGNLEEISAGKDAIDFFSRVLPRELIAITAKPENYRWSMRKWIERAWIPLALWEVMAGPWQSVHDLLLEAQKCCPAAQGVTLEAEPFRHTWMKLRSMTKKASQ